MLTKSLSTRLVNTIFWFTFRSTIMRALLRAASALMQKASPQRSAALEKNSISSGLTPEISFMPDCSM